MTVLVDSDILIEVSRGKNAAIHARWLQLSESGDPVLYSAVSSTELWAGARPGEHTALSRLFRSLSCAAVDGESAETAGAYLRNYRRSHGVEIADALIAACAFHHHAFLWTRNRKHYPMNDISFYE